MRPPRAPSEQGYKPCVSVSEANAVSRTTRKDFSSVTVTGMIIYEQAHLKRATKGYLEI